MRDFSEMAEACRDRAREYRKYARNVGKMNDARQLAATTPTGGEVVGRPSELRDKFSKRAQNYDKLALLAEKKAQLDHQLADLRERINNLEEKNQTRRRWQARGNGHRG